MIGQSISKPVSLHAYKILKILSDDNNLSSYNVRQVILNNVWCITDVSINPDINTSGITYEDDTSIDHYNWIMLTL